MLRSALSSLLFGGLLLSGCSPTWVERDLILDDVMPREAWDANHWRDGVERHDITHITIHHTAERRRSDRSIEKKLQALQEFSQNERPLADGRTKPEWPDVPYHFFIDHTGQVAEARPLGYKGDSNTAYDPEGHALIVLEGNFEEEEPTPGQVVALMRMTASIARKYGVDASEIGVHRDYADTLCPGENLESLLPQIRAMVGEAR